MNIKITLVAALFVVFGLCFGLSMQPAPINSYIVQGATVADIKALVVEYGGDITH